MLMTLVFVYVINAILENNWSWAISLKLSAQQILTLKPTKLQKNWGKCTIFSKDFLEDNPLLRSPSSPIYVLIFLERFFNIHTWLSNILWITSSLSKYCVWLCTFMLGKFTLVKFWKHFITTVFIYKPLLDCQKISLTTQKTYS